MTLGRVAGVLGSSKGLPAFISKSSFEGEKNWSGSLLPAPFGVFAYGPLMTESGVIPVFNPGGLPCRANGSFFGAEGVAPSQKVSELRGTLPLMPLGGGDEAKTLPGAALPGS